MLSRVIAKNVGDVFFETQCISTERGPEVVEWSKYMHHIFGTYPRPK